MKSKVSPIKELVDPEKIQAMAYESAYPRPRWMLNNSVNDKVWRLASNGIARKFYEKNNVKSHTLNFDMMMTSPNESLTDKVNLSLLTDIRHSILYLDINGKIKSPRSVISIVRSIVSLLHHTNELRIIDGKPLVRTLAEIKFNDLKSYLLAYGVEVQTFESTLTFIYDEYERVEDIDWNIVKLH
ncbi:hypothetical protein, partial [Aeromonas media]|uniref:hypothetical protein n=1 Tax=Aeromonas media TaxID=651 RepID=UPI003D0416FE